MIIATTRAPRESQARFIASTSVLFQQVGEQHGRVHRRFVGEIGDLMTAAGAAGHYDRAGRLVTNGWKQLALADGARHREGLASVAKRPRHTAAARVEIDDRGTWNRSEQRFRWCQQRHRLLMTVAVKQDRIRPRLERQS